MRSKAASAGESRSPVSASAARRSAVERDDSFTNTAPPASTLFFLPLLAPFAARHCGVSCAPFWPLSTPMLAPILPRFLRQIAARRGTRTGGVTPQRQPSAGATYLRIDSMTCAL